MKDIWKSYNLGQAPVLRQRTVAWHVNDAMKHSGKLSSGQHLILSMMNNNILKYTNERIVLIRRTPARIRDCKRFKKLLAACIKDAYRHEEGFRISNLPENWLSLSKLREVEDVLHLIEV